MEKIEMPHVSVIMSTVAVDAWFLDAVKSVLLQDEVDFELVVVLDGAQSAPDADWRDDSRVRVIEKAQRSGLANALRTAIQVTSSPYVARMDADDLCAPGRLAQQVAFLDESADTVLLGTRASRINEHGIRTGSLGDAPRGNLAEHLLRRNLLIHPSVMFRREAYDAAGGYDSRLRTMEDYDLWLRMAPFGRVETLQDELISYRVHSTQMSRRAVPTGVHIDCIKTSQKNLARELGVPAITGLLHRSVWQAAQFLRYYGMRRPGYDD